MMPALTRETDVIKFFIWLAIFTAIHPVLGIVHVVASIVWLLRAIAQDERDRQRRRPLT